MNDFASISNRPRPIVADGRTYLIHPFSVADFGALQVWVDSQFPDPFDLVDAQIEKGRLVTEPDGSRLRQPYPMAVQQFLLRTAHEAASKGRRLIGMAEADEKLQSVDGLKELLYLAILKGDPSFTREDAAKLYPKLSVGQVSAVFAHTGAALVCNDPKAPGAAGTPTASNPPASISGA
jgi:hypothetical protein